MMMINVVGLIFLLLYDAGAFTVCKFLQSKQHQQEIKSVYFLNECKNYLTSCCFIKVFQMCDFDDVCGVMLCMNVWRTQHRTVTFNVIALR